MKTLIQKFGGTSLATEESRKKAIDKIIEAKSRYENIVIVVSAMGRIGAPYATDTLLSLVNGNQSNLSSREMDLLMSCGEIISSLVIANNLNANGAKACALTGGNAGIITDQNFREANIINIETERLNKLLREGFIPIVAGFQGITTSGDITTIGRGGSDTTAALLGEALHADGVEIYTDVDGIMTADPRICPSAQIINEINYNEVFQMADSGAKVIHPRAVEIARRSGIPLIIKNTFSDAEGTKICQYNRLDTKKILKDKLITSIAHRLNRIQFSIMGKFNDDQFFTDLASKNVSIDIINIFPDRKIFTTDSNCKNSVISLINQYDIEYSVIEGCCKVTVIGEKMTGVPGVMAKIIRALSSEGIEILQTADSLATIACLIKEKDLKTAVKVLHKEFLLN